MYQPHPVYSDRFIQEKNGATYRGENKNSGCSKTCSFTAFGETAPKKATRNVRCVRVKLRAH